MGLLNNFIVLQFFETQNGMFIQYELELILSIIPSPNQPSIFVPGKLKRESSGAHDQAVGASAPDYASPLPPGK